MKFKIWTLLFVPFLYMCSNAQQPVNTEALRGTWLVRDYVQDISKNKSPFGAYRLAKGISCILVRKLDHDTLNTGVLINNHEGNEVNFVYDGRTNSYTMLGNETEGYLGETKLQMDMSATDTLLSLHYFKSGTLERKKVFKKISAQLIEDPFGKFANKIIFEGKYLAIDRNNKSAEEKIELTTDGVIEGSVDFSSYKVITDYAVQPGEFDLVIFQSKDSSRERLLIYEIKNSDVYLYNTNAGPERDILKGSLYCILKKENK